MKVNVLNILRKIASGLAWPFVEAAHALFSKHGFDAAKQVFEGMRDTAFGHIVLEAVDAVNSIKAGQTDMWALEQAFTKITAECIAQGIEIKDSLVMFAIQTVIQAFKNAWVTHDDVAKLESEGGK